MEVSNGTNYMKTPAWLNSGDNAWQMMAATLVAMMTIPGLAAIYAGLVRESWAANAGLMTFYAFASTLVCWVVFAYKMAFGEWMTFFWGKPGVALTSHYLLQQAALPASVEHYSNGTVKTPMEMAMFPMATLVYFQFAFAAVAVVLVAGALLGRMKFHAWMLFVPLWLTLSYTMGAFSIWGGGFLYHWGVIDFAGGFVVHLSAGSAGFTAAAWVGKRGASNLTNMQEAYSLPLVAVGAGLLWLGWTGFNGGAPYGSGLAASMAVLNTYIAAATGVAVWTALDVFHDGESSLIHAVQGMVVGLVCITPSAGVVEGWAAIIIGLCGGSITWYIRSKIEQLEVTKEIHRLERLGGRRPPEVREQNNIRGRLVWLWKWLSNVDDTLKVVETHAISGMIGGLLAGLLAEPQLCDLYLPIKGSKGAFYGHPLQLGKQLCAAILVIVWNIVITSGICWFISLIIPDLVHRPPKQQIPIPANNYLELADRQIAKQNKECWLKSEISQFTCWQRHDAQPALQPANGPAFVDDEPAHATADQRHAAMYA